MARSEAQKRADKKYAETHKGDFVTWTTKVKPQEATKIDSIAKANGMSRADFIRWAAEQLEKQQS